MAIECAKIKQISILLGFGEGGVEWGERGGGVICPDFIWNWLGVDMVWKDVCEHTDTRVRLDTEK